MTPAGINIIALLAALLVGGANAAFTFSLNDAIASTRKLGHGSWHEMSGWIDRALSNEIDFSLREGPIEYADGVGPSLAKHSTSASFNVATFNGVRGVGTKRALEAGEVFMVLPCSIAITTTDAFFDDVAGPVVRKLAETHPQEYHSQAITMLFLMTEALQYNSSRFAPYMGLLPPMGPGIMPIMDITGRHWLSRPISTTPPLTPTPTPPTCSAAKPC